MHQAESKERKQFKLGCYLTLLCLCRCIVCRLRDNRRIRVETVCKDCKVFLCINMRNCFSLYHQESDLAKKCRLEVDRLRVEKPDDCIFVFPHQIIKS